MRLRHLVSAIVVVAAMTPLAGFAAASDEPQSVASDGPVRLSVRVDKLVTQVADPVQLVIAVEAPQGTRVELPRLPGKWGDFEVQGTQQVKDIPSADHAGSRRWVLRTTLETIKTGNLTVPSLDVHYAMDANATTFKTLHSRPIQVRVASVLENRADPTKFRDIKDTVDFAVPELHSYAWIGWTAAGIGAAGAFALLALVVVKRRRGPSPAAWALAQIADLEQLSIGQAADAEAIYNELVDVVREFFELEFNVPTLSRTTREFLAQAANDVGMEETPRKRLALLASMADEIKFARLGVGEQQLRQAFDHAKALVHECQEHRLAVDKEGA